MTKLTQDELTVLLIASQGESMMPIGRWQAPVESLLKRGYLHANDRFNNVITPEGRIAAELTQSHNERAVAEVHNEIQMAQARARQMAEGIAAQLVELSQISSKVTAETSKKALERWSRIILTRALELLQ